MNNLPFKMPVVDWLALTASDDDIRVELKNEDPVALGCAAYRLWDFKSSNPRFTNFSFIKTTPEDYQLAKEIKSYYIKRLTLKKLKYGKLTPFAEDLYNLVSEKDSIDEVRKKVGMIYRLPYFYQEDLDRDYLTEYFRNQTLNYGPVSRHETRRLFPVKKIFRSRRDGEKLEYWWKDHNNEPVLWSFKNNTGFGNLIDSLFDHDHCDIHCYFHIDKQYGQDLVFWHMTNDYAQFPKPTAASSL